ncbi:ATP-binding protein [Streptomyces sp. NPDC058442]|uniref:ATP-binding protein n=1 Tax=Streptomyces sp. NPDC058442 TaxID=3346503 RepID=UPI00365A12B4
MPARSRLIRALVRWPRRYRRLTLRSRVTLWATSIVAVAVIAVGLGLLAGLRHSLWSRLDTAAQQRVSDVSTLVRDHRLRDPIPSNGSDADVVVVVDSSGHVVSSSDYDIHPGQASGLPRPLPARIRDGHAATLTDLPIGDGGDFRVAARPARLKGVPVTVIAAVSLEQSEHTLDSLVAGLAIGVPALTALVAWTIWLTAGRTLRPVETLRRQATEISATGLHRRLDLPPSQDEVHALATTLNDMLSRLDQASAAQRRFVADAAHELRSPLAAVMAQLEVMAAYPDPERDPKTAADLLEDTLRLHDLVEGLLALARSEDPAARRPSGRVVDLDEVVLAEVRHQRGLSTAAIDARGVSAGRVRGDAEALRRVVRNLLDNARRHAAHHVRVRLDQHGDTVELTVSDDGTGIPEPDRLRVFERFTRLDEARSRDAGGSGLGLAIVGKVVTAHGGVAYADQDPPPTDGGLGGARLVVRLPSA